MAKRNRVRETARRHHQWAGVSRLQQREAVARAEAEMAETVDGTDVLAQRAVQRRQVVAEVETAQQVLYGKEGSDPKLDAAISLLHRRGYHVATHAEYDRCVKGIVNHALVRVFLAQKRNSGLPQEMIDAIADALEKAGF